MRINTKHCCMRCTKGDGEVAHAGGKKKGSKRTSRSGSETRQQTAKLQMRMRKEVRAALEEAARRQGFPDTKALVLHRLQPDIALVRPDLPESFE
jgi:hypothetical protein